MDLATGARAVKARLRDFYKTELGHRFPFMSADAIGKLATDCGPLLEKRVIKQAAQATKAQPRSPFLALPAELRNSIYEYLVFPKYGDGGTPNVLGICIQRSCPKDWYFSKIRGRPRKAKTFEEEGTLYGYYTEWRVPPMIAQVSQQVRREVLPLYYSANVFVGYSTVWGGDYYLMAVKEWLGLIERERAGMVKHLSTRFGPESGSDAKTKSGVIACLEPEKYGLARASVRMV